MMKDLSKEAGLSRLYTNRGFATKTAGDVEIAEDVTSGEIKTHISRLYRTETNNAQAQDTLLTEEETSAVMKSVPVPESTEIDTSGNLEMVSSISMPASSLTWKPLEKKNFSLLTSLLTESSAVPDVPVVSEIISSQAIAVRSPEHALRSDIGPHSAQTQKQSESLNLLSHTDVLSNVQPQAETVAGNAESIEVDGQHNTQTPESSAPNQKRIVTPQAIQMEKQTIQEARELQRVIFASPPIHMKKPATTPRMLQKHTKSVTQPTSKFDTTGLPKQLLELGLPKQLHELKAQGSRKVVKVYPGMSHHEVLWSIRTTPKQSYNPAMQKSSKSQTLQKQPSAQKKQLSDNLQQVTPASSIHKAQSQGQLKLPTRTIMHPSPKLANRSEQPQQWVVASDLVQPTDESLKVDITLNPLTSDSSIQGSMSQTQIVPLTSNPAEADSEEQKPVIVIVPQSVQVQQSTFGEHLNPEDSNTPDSNVPIEKHLKEGRRVPDPVSVNTDFVVKEEFIEEVKSESS